MEALSSFLAAISTKVWAFVYAGIGGVFGVLASPQMPKKSAAVYVLMGSFIGATIATLISWKLGIPEFATNCMAALLGLPGIGLVVSVIKLLKNPLATLKEIRGRK